MSSHPVRRSTPERDQLIEAHLPLARKLARRYRGRGETLDDLVQVGALGLIRASDRFDPGRGVAFGTFAARVIDGEIRRHLRCRMRLAPVAGDEAVQDIHDPAEPHAVGEARAFVSRSMEALDDRERRTVFLRFEADMTERQIASVLGISQAQVSRILNRALAKLRAELGRPDDDGDQGSPSRDIAHAELISPEKSGHGAGNKPNGRRSSRNLTARERGNTVTTRSGGYSGRFLVRMPGELHEELARCAQEANVSLNRLVTDVLAASTSTDRPTATDSARAADAQDEGGPGPVRTPRALRLAVAANLSVLVLTAAAALILVALALQRGI